MCRRRTAMQPSPLDVMPRTRATRRPTASSVSAAFSLVHMALGTRCISTSVARPLRALLRPVQQPFHQLARRRDAERPRAPRVSVRGVWTLSLPRTERGDRGPCSPMVAARRLQYRPVDNGFRHFPPAATPACSRPLTPPPKSSRLPHVLTEGSPAGRSNRRFVRHCSEVRNRAYWSIHSNTPSG